MQPSGLADPQAEMKRFGTHENKKVEEDEEKHRECKFNEGLSRNTQTKQNLEFGG